jgi:hypothetical protein
VALENREDSETGLRPVRRGGAQGEGTPPPVRLLRLKGEETANSLLCRSIGECGSTGSARGEGGVTEHRFSELEHGGNE